MEDTIGEDNDHPITSMLGLINEQVDLKMNSETTQKPDDLVVIKRLYLLEIVLQV